ncbi:MAG: phosphotransferase [Actinomycetota bacterium]
MSETLEAAVHVTGWERIEPWFVVRCTLESDSRNVPTSVIVKSLRAHPAGFRTDPQQVLTERAALEFVSDLGLDLAPRLFAGQQEAGVLIMEDLAPRKVLFDLIRDKDPATDEGLSAFARALAELGTGTVGRSGQYYERRSVLGPVDPQADRLRLMGWGWSETRRFCETLGVPIAGAAETEMSAVVDAVVDPGPFLAFSNGDAGANNYLVEGSDGRIIDFEFAGYRHALADAVCLYVPGPMWMTVSDPIAEGYERIYRAALSEGIAEAADDKRYGAGIAVACIAFAVERLHRFPKLDARMPGHESRRQLIWTLESAIRAAEAHSSHAHASGWLARVADSLRRRWPDVDGAFDRSAGYSLRV